MTGIVLLSIFAIACLVHISFVISDIRDALHEVRSMLREHLFALETVIAKLDDPLQGTRRQYMTHQISET